MTLLVTSSTHAAGVLYANPGWGYAFEGAEAYYNDPDGPNPDYISGNATNLPGGRANTAALEFPGFVDSNCNPNTTACEVKNDTATWIHSGSQWDGSAPGDPLGGNPGNPVPIPPAAPGGVETYTVGGTSYLRIQDAGNPQSWGWADKNAQASANSSRQEGNNRRIQFAHKIERDAAYSGNGAVLDNGITIALRTRLSTAASGPLDPFVSEDGPSTTSPVAWPVDGKGYPVGNNGRGMFMVTQNGASGPGQIAFSLLDTNTINDEGYSNSKTGLVFNNKFGGPDTDDATADTLNIVEVENSQLTQWQEFWITIKKLAVPIGESTHEVSVYNNGSLTPQVFPTALGSQNEFGNGPHLGLGLSSGTRSGRIRHRLLRLQGRHFRSATRQHSARRRLQRRQFRQRRRLHRLARPPGRDTALPNETATPGTVTIDDYSAWKANFGATAGSGGFVPAVAVPEPASISFALAGVLAGLILQRHSRIEAQQ